MQRTLLPRCSQRRPTAAPCQQQRPSSRQLCVRPLAATGHNNFYGAAANLAKAISCPYGILGVAPGATESEIKTAYRVKAKACHPDACKDPLTALAFMDCQRAYELLLDPEQRAKYDRTLQPKANRDALSYLNMVSAQRHGVSSRGRTQRAPVDRELHTTMLELLRQVKTCTQVLLDRELRIGRSHASSSNAGAAAAAQQTPQPVRIAVANLECDVECGDHGEGCEPWIYYAAASAAAEAAQQQRHQQ